MRRRAPAAALRCGAGGARLLLTLAARARRRRSACAPPSCASDEDGFVLNAEFDVAINATLEEALQKGMPLYFVLEFELSRPRWYWLDEKVLVNSTVSTASPGTR